MKWFSVKNWSRYSRQYADNNDALYKYKRVILLSQFTLFGAIIGVIHALEDLIDGLIFMPAMDFIMSIAIFSCYLLNEKGYHRAAKLSLLGFLNIFFFIYSSLADRELGIFLYYFPWIALAAVIFESHESRERIFFISLSVLLLVTLFVTKFEAFGATQFEAVAIGRSFVINMVSSIIVLVFFITFMIRMNDDSEKRLFDLAAEIQTKNQSLEKINNELDRFLYSTSHDLRSPLMSVKGLTEIVQLETTEQTTKEYMMLMRDRIDKLDFFIKDIIDYSRNIKTEVVLEEIDLNAMVDEVIENYKFMEGAASIHFIRALNIDKVVSDKNRMRVILNNLISNGIKYRNPYSNKNWIKIGAQHVNATVQIEISDNGLGIAEEHRDKIFNMFYRATDKSKGSGLGLYIVKEAVEKMNGSIALDCSQHTTRFVVELPYATSIA